MRLLLGLFIALWFALPAQAQLSIRGTDPCFANLSATAAINVTSATTTSLVAVSGIKAVYVCGVFLTIAPSAVTADTAVFEYGTGSTCTSPTALTGTLGAGTTVAGSASIAQVLSLGDATSTIFSAPSGNGICLLSAGGTVNIQGWINYVQK